MQKETETTGKADTQRAQQREQLNQILQENKMLKSKVNQEKFELQQSLDDANRKVTVLEAQKTQLETRLSQVEGRKETELAEQAAITQSQEN